MQLAVLLVDRDVAARRGARSSRASSLGGVARRASSRSLYLLRYGDMRRVRCRSRFVDVPQVYRFIWAKSAQEILGEEGPLMVARCGLAVAALLFGARRDARAAAAHARRSRSRRSAAIVNVAVAAQGLRLPLPSAHRDDAHRLHGRRRACSGSASAPRRAARRSVASRRSSSRVAYALEVDVEHEGLAAHAERVDPRRRRDPGAADARGVLRHASRRYDFFPWELRQARGYLAREDGRRTHACRSTGWIRTSSSSRSAGRATPYIYAYDLNADAALDGGWSNVPTESTAMRIKARARRARAGHARAPAAPRRPRRSSSSTARRSSRAPTRGKTSATAAGEREWVASNYHPAKSFGEVHVWLRDDLPVSDNEMKWP